MGNKYTADFETTTDENDCRVWAWGLCEIGNYQNFIYGNTINSFMEYLEKSKKNLTLYFHNLKFDGEYIFSYLLNNGYECIQNKKDTKDKTFTTLISSLGQFYSIEIYFSKSGKKVNKVTIYDSLKLLNMSVDNVAKSFGLPISKLELDYKEYRSVGHELTEHEIDYLRNDVEIMSRALDTMFNENLTKMTIGSNALTSFKKTISFDTYYPILPYEITKSIKQSYKGGFTYLNPIYAGEELHDLMVVDKNSMHPSHMYYDYLPFGTPIYFEGEYKEDKIYPMYIQQLSCSFKIKPHKIPSIQVKLCTFSSLFKPNEYIEDTKGEILTLTLTDIDLKLFFDQYEITSDITYHCGYKFKRLKGLFGKYIDYWTDRKIKAGKDGNKGQRQIAKLMLNSLYGKFGLNPVVRGKYPYLNENGIVRYGLYPEEIRDPVYMAVASYVTAYSRDDIIRTAQKIRDYSLEKYNEDYFIYTDTDSIHMKKLSEEELGQLIELDKFELGKYDIEEYVKTAIYLRQKCYIHEDYEGNITSTIAGLPKKLSKYVNLDNFKVGFSIMASEEDKEHKLRYKHVKGGVILADTDFTIK